MALATYRLETPFGPIHVLESERGLACMTLGEARSQATLDRWRRRHEPEASLRTRKADGPVADQLGEYFAGERTQFSLALDLRGTPFQVKVWQGLVRIPYGSVQTYGELARGIGSPSSFRAVGGANGANPLPIVIPCHRVVARTGLGGFSGPMAWKQSLLTLEGACLNLSK
ncbi:MAG: methylated-DNA--[protein]-cysteine S-methyltransferase [Planctomycetes bacterium]|nr:methylated-DNA--[protein]-cysteine S-methyltransferase [Planctomycetota bacterium]MCB9910743.1 methylated-DNA--[protein]-cysteine S-methyltransferase [Planctomycetota bacterium]MCB9912769.1 methylated-DNA--[protein]-cysteine S-methyltransferase [Planctomycetota bacterium]HPF14300.1 methylated-DNA--[protein]-cysteine S-methyltransferase [Planctomycetota bacterium]HRV80761.1 methylated-DNA--[protein]-cysteine S-methyltransferase [Planctomycetota bacterium]